MQIKALSSFGSNVAGLGWVEHLATLLGGPQIANESVGPMREHRGACDPRIAFPWGRVSPGVRAAVGPGLTS